MRNTVFKRVTPSIGGGVPLIIVIINPRRVVRRVPSMDRLDRNLRVEFALTGRTRTPVRDRGSQHASYRCWWLVGWHLLVPCAATYISSYRFSSPPRSDLPVSRRIWQSGEPSNWPWTDLNRRIRSNFATIVPWILFLFLLECFFFLDEPLYRSFYDPSNWIKIELVTLVSSNSNSCSTLNQLNGLIKLLILFTQSTVVLPSIFS